MFEVAMVICIIILGLGYSLGYIHGYFKAYGIFTAEDETENEL